MVASTPQNSEFLDTLIATAKRHAAGLDATTVRECKTAALKQAERLSSFQDRRGQRTGKRDKSGISKSGLSQKPWTPVGISCKPCVC